MDNMASAATNYKTVLEQIVTTMTTQYVTKKALLQYIKPQRGSNNSGQNSGSNHIPDGNDMRKFKKTQRNAASYYIERMGERGLLIDPRPRHPRWPQQPHLSRRKTRSHGNGYPRESVGTRTVLEQRIERHLDLAGWDSSYNTE